MSNPSSLPFLSIICALHNKAHYIEKTINSALSQSIGSFEVLVVENRSTDDGYKVVEEWARRDSRVRLIMAPPEVRGPGGARNCGLSEARGEWILFLDADDLLEPDYLERRLSVLKSYPEAKIIAGPWKNFYPDAPDVFETHFPNGWSPPHSNPPDSIFAYSPWALHAAIVHREILGSSNPWLEELDGFPAEDNAFWFRVLYGKTIYWDDCAGAIYRKQTENSRDQSGVDFQNGFAATLATFRFNLDFLTALGKLPSDSMSATAVRVLRKWRAMALAGNESAIPEIESEIRNYLGLTSAKNIRMLFWKVYFFTRKILERHRN